LCPTDGGLGVVQLLLCYVIIFMATPLFPIDGGLGGGEIAGIVIGVLIAVALVAVLAFFLVR
jgi:hypothetical protein